MIEASYVPKLRQAYSTEGYMSERATLKCLETFNEDEWKDFLTDVIQEAESSPQFGQLNTLLGTPLGHSLLSHVALLMQKHAIASRRIVTNALERVATQVLAEKRSEGVLKSVVFLAAVAYLPGFANTLARLVLCTDVSDEIRARAANALTDLYSEELPADFWNAIDLTRTPFLAPAVLTRLAKQDPEVCLRTLCTLPQQPDPSALHHPIRNAVRQLQQQPRGIGRLRALLASMDGWAKQVVLDVLREEEFATIHDVISEPELAQVPQRVEALVRRVSELDDALKDAAIAEETEVLTQVWRNLPQDDREQIARSAESKLRPVESIRIDKFSSPEILYLGTQPDVLSTSRFDGSQLMVNAYEAKRRKRKRSHPL